MALSDDLTRAVILASALETQVTLQADTIADLQVAVESRETTIASLREQIAESAVEIANLADRLEIAGLTIEAQEAEISDLKRRLAAATRTTLVGFSSASSRTDTLDAKRTVYGPSGIVRRFSAGKPSPSLLPEDGTPVALSYKDADAAALKATLIAARDRGISGYWTYHHEPEDNLTTSAQQADYRSTWRRLLAAADEVPGVTLEPLVILMAWSLSPASGRDWTAWDPDPSLPIGFDLYKPANVQHVLDWHERTGRDFAIPEFGATGTDEDRLAKIETMIPPLLEAKPLFVTYFDSTVGGAYPLNSYPRASAKWREFATA